MTFAQKIRLIALLAGIAFFAVGVVMICVGVAAEGTVDVRSAFLSGTLKTGSAGLFVAFFAFLMIGLATLQPMEDGLPHRRPTARVFWALFSLIVGGSIAVILYPTHDTDTTLLRLAGLGFLALLGCGCLLMIYAGNSDN